MSDPEFVSIGLELGEGVKVEHHCERAFLTSKPHQADTAPATGRLLAVEV
jgi:hypothetical protein